VCLSVCFCLSLSVCDFLSVCVSRSLSVCFSLSQCGCLCVVKQAEIFWLHRRQLLDIYSVAVAS